MEPGCAGKEAGTEARAASSSDPSTQARVSQAARLIAVPSQAVELKRLGLGAPRSWRWCWMRPRCRPCAQSWAADRRWQQQLLFIE